MEDISKRGPNQLFDGVARPYKWVAGVPISGVISYNHVYNW